MISRSIKSIIRLGKDGVGVDIDIREKHDGKIDLDRKDEIAGNEIGNNKGVKVKNHQKTSKSKKLLGYSDFFTSKTR